MVVAFSFDYHTLLSWSLLLYLASLAALVAGPAGPATRPAGRRGGSASARSASSRPSSPKLATALFLARYLGGPTDRALGLRQILAGDRHRRRCRWCSSPSSPISAAPRCSCRCSPGCCWSPACAARYLVAAFAAGAGGRRAGLELRHAAVPAPARPHLPGARRAIRWAPATRCARRRSPSARASSPARGYRQGTQSQLRFLPARHTDFILAVLAEEWGFLGVATVLALYALYLVERRRGGGARARPGRHPARRRAGRRWSPSTSSTTRRW